MPGSKVTDGEFVELFTRHGANETARRLSVDVRNVYHRRRKIEDANGGIALVPPDPRSTRVPTPEHPVRHHLDVKSGIVLVGSDAHNWPGKPSTAHRAFVRFVKELKPKAIIRNGDDFDGATVSRHLKIGWEKQPSVIEEIEINQGRLGEIEAAKPKGCDLVWNLGNHDARFETRLANAAPEYALVHGIHLRDHFPLWTPAWSTWINSDVVVKHRWKGGVHATHNNAVGSGKTMVTGHLHSAKVTPVTDYNGTRYGVDTGCLADIYAKQFNYAEDNPRNWRSGFCVLTFRDGKLMQPELALVWDADHVEFRGELVRV